MSKTKNKSELKIGHLYKITSTDKNDPVVDLYTNYEAPWEEIIGSCIVIYLGKKPYPNYPYSELWYQFLYNNKIFYIGTNALKCHYKCVKLTNK